MLGMADNSCIPESSEWLWELDNSVQTNARFFLKDCKGLPIHTAFITTLLIRYVLTHALAISSVYRIVTD